MSSSSNGGPDENPKNPPKRRQSASDSTSKIERRIIACEARSESIWQNKEIEGI